MSRNKLLLKPPASARTAEDCPRRRGRRRYNGHLDP